MVSNLHSLKFIPYFIGRKKQLVSILSLTNPFQQDVDKSTQTWDALEWWLASIVVHAPNSPVAIVGTHEDCAEPSLGRGGNSGLEKCLTFLLLDFPRSTHLFPSFFLSELTPWHSGKCLIMVDLCWVWFRHRITEMNHLSMADLLPWGLPEASRPSIHAEVHQRITAFCKKLPELNEWLGRRRWFVTCPDHFIPPIKATRNPKNGHWKAIFLVGDCNLPGPIFLGCILNPN